MPPHKPTPHALVMELANRDTLRAADARHRTLIDGSYRSVALTYRTCPTCGSTGRLRAFSPHHNPPPTEP